VDDGGSINVLSWLNGGVFGSKDDDETIFVGRPSCIGT